LQGIDFIGYNNQIPKHKLSKLSILSDINGKPIDILLSKGNKHDALGKISKIFFLTH